MHRLVIGTEVVVIRGNDKGKRGKVAKLLKDKDRVVVEGVNQVKRHLKPTPQRQGGILQVEAALPVSHVMPIDPTSGKGTRVKYAVKEGKKVRIAKGGQQIPERAR